MRLKEDVVGMYSKIEYGKAGDEVKVVSEHGDMVIVENTEGSRFPMLKIHLTEEKIIHEAAPDTAAPNNKPIINRAPVSKKKAASTNQNTLF
jgi:formylmethanofuran dehydrogenase subunit D